MKPIWAPFGFLHSMHELPLASPPRWFQPTGNIASWFGTFEANAADINEHVWPAWDQLNHCWNTIGISVKDASALASVDVQLCRRLAELLPHNVFTGSKYTHLVSFGSEDQDGFSQSVDDYLASTGISGDFVGRASDAAKNIEIVIYAYKRHFRRPRPYNAALVLGLPHFSWQMATSSLHPSLISGHAAQGLIGITAAWIQENPNIQKASYERAMQLAVDFGDRRVMAGVHYPSDNFSSWITIARYAKHFAWWNKSEKLAALDFMQSAIHKYSSVYSLCRTGEYRSQYDELDGWLARAFDEERIACSV